MFRNDNRAPAAPRPVTIGLVNNMGDGALVATERQFARALGAGAPGASVRLERFFMPSVPRGPEAAAHLAEHYRDVAELDAAGVDGLIVTGSEPRAPDLREEPYWPDFQRLVDWAEAHTASTLWSCMAAHAAVLHLHGVERVPLKTKCSGVFAVADRERPAGAWRVPHSRFNTLDKADLTGCGYVVEAEADGAGVDRFRLQTRSLFVFVQGHPEYDAGSLRGEYQRDFRRWLRGERPAAPAIPAGYFEPHTELRLAELAATATALGLERALARLGHILETAVVSETWRPYAAAVYGDWLGSFEGVRRVA